MDLSNKNIVHIKKDGIEYLQFKRLLEYKNLVHCYTLKGNQMNFRAYLDGPIERQKTLLQNYENLCKIVGFNYNNLVKPRQTHTNIVMDVENVGDGPNVYTEDYLDVDGLITNLENVPIATTNADCILMMLFDPVTNTIANIHSGWRGTASKIILNGISLLKNKYGVKTKDLICCICPSIRVCHFEVDEDVRNIFEGNFKELERMDEIIKVGNMKDGKQKYNIDTVLINKILLENAGVISGNIIDSNICSNCNSSLIHSRRADGEDFNLGTAVISLR